MSPPVDPPPALLDQAMENFLVRAGTEGERRLLLAIWIHQGVQYMARDFGRATARQTLESQLEFVKTANPARPWRD